MTFTPRKTKQNKLKEKISQKIKKRKETQIKLMPNERW